MERQDISFAIQIITHSKAGEDKAGRSGHNRLMD
jgi:hypothetical protein